MKNILLATLVMCVATTAFSQTEKGDFLVGGSIGFRTNKNNSNFTLAPNGGYFFADNFAAGANLSLTLSRKGDIKSTEFELGPFVRYYLGKTNVRPFLVTSVGFSSLSDKTGTAKISTNGYYFLAGLGYAAFITDAVALEGIAAYNYTDYKNASSFNGFSLNFGFQVYLNKRRIEEIKSGNTL